MKLITNEMAALLMPAYQHSAETGETSKPIIAKFFTPWAGATWYITEGWPLYNGEPIAEDRVDAIVDTSAYDWHLFGWCDLGDPGMAELGYVNLDQLKEITGPGGLKIERDLHYTGVLSDVVPWMDKDEAA